METPFLMLLSIKGYLKPVPPSDYLYVQPFYKVA